MSKENSPKNLDRHFNFDRQSQLNFKALLKRNGYIDMSAVRMNYLHLFNEYVVFLHPSAFHYAPLPNPSSWSCTSPQLHAPLSAFHPCSLLSTLSAPYIFFGTGMKVLSGDGNVEARRGAEKRKSCGEVKREGERTKQWSTQMIWTNTI